MLKCQECGKNITDKTFLLDSSSHQPLYWRLIGNNYYAFCGPKCSSEWHRKMESQ